MSDRVRSLAMRRLHDASDAGLIGPTTPEERLALVETLSREAWTLTGFAWPTYARADAPVRVVGLRARDVRSSDA